ncbi:hypothetical protein [Kiloniella sp.]|uniref:hypothetical protein n=1 Tax=Kiloniella sp. TaxID=1938587 RepID=UPI003B013169
MTEKFSDTIEIDGCNPPPRGRTWCEGSDLLEKVRIGGIRASEQAVIARLNEKRKAAEIVQTEDKPGEPLKFKEGDWSFWWDETERHWKCENKGIYGNRVWSRDDRSQIINFIKAQTGREDGPQ